MFSVYKIRQFVGRVCVAAVVSCLCLISSQAVARESARDRATETSTWRGLVTRVIDGDTIKVIALTAAPQKPVKLRLTDIDAPETRHGRDRPGQPFGQAARRYLSDLTLNKNVSLECYGQATYDREDVCRVRVDGVDAGRELVKAGLAWVENNPRYVRDKSMHEVQKEAQTLQLGLWRSKEKPIEPWVWRRVCWKDKQCEQGE